MQRSIRAPEESPITPLAIPLERIENGVSTPAPASGYVMERSSQKKMTTQEPRTCACSFVPTSRKVWYAASDSSKLPLRTISRTIFLMPYQPRTMILLLRIELLQLCLRNQLLKYPVAAKYCLREQERRDRLWDKNGVP